MCSCVEKVVWRFKYDKYKPLKQAGTCSEYRPALPQPQPCKTSMRVLPYSAGTTWSAPHNPLQGLFFLSCPLLASCRKKNVKVNYRTLCPACAGARGVCEGCCEAKDAKSDDAKAKGGKAAGEAAGAAAGGEPAGGGSAAAASDAPALAGQAQP